MGSIEDKEKDRIYKEWIAISYEHGFDYTLFWKIMAVIVVLFVITGYWVRVLKKQIILRQEAEAKLHELNQSLKAEVKTQVKALREKERQLLEQSKMAAMGEMIGIIAHQLKQPLNAIGLQAQDVKDAYDYNELDEAYLKRFSESILRNVEYMSATVDDFRNFFNPNKQKKDFDVKELLEKTVQLLSAQFSNHNINIRIEAAPVTLHGVKNELQQIIINLANNAKDAFLERENQERLITIKAYLDGTGRNLVIEFADTAGGIDGTIVERIFESYFSTKGEEGTGIGLHMVRMMVQDSFSGEIKVENREQGACFTITIPLENNQLTRG